MEALNDSATKQAAQASSRPVMDVVAPPPLEPQDADTGSQHQAVPKTEVPKVQAPKQPSNNSLATTIVTALIVVAALSALAVAAYLKG